MYIPYLENVRTLGMHPRFSASKRNVRYERESFILSDARVNTTEQVPHYLLKTHLSSVRGRTVKGANSTVKNMAT